MSVTTKTKHVMNEMLDEFPEPSGSQCIVKIVCPRGNNLHEVKWPDGKTSLASMPEKYRKRVWVKRGDFVIIEPIEENDKVGAEMIHILLPPHVRHLKVQNMWPPEFASVDRRYQSVVDSGETGGGAAAEGKAEAAECVECVDDSDGGAVDAASEIGIAVAGEELAVYEEEQEESEDDMSDLQPNNNRRRYVAEEDDDSEED